MDTLKHNSQTLQLQQFELPTYDAALLPQTEMADIDAKPKHSLFVVQHDCLGHVAAPEGCKLMASLLDQFVELEALPAAVILQGQGVALAAPDNAAQAALVRYISLGVRVLICQRSVEALESDCQLEGSELVEQREIAKQMVLYSDIIWL